MSNGEKLNFKSSKPTEMACLKNIKNRVVHKVMILLSKNSLLSVIFYKKKSGT